MKRKRLKHVKPSPENDELYGPVDYDDPEIRELAESIRQHGLREPLVITKDRYILSGHRRFAAMNLLGLKTALCRVEDFKREEDSNRFVTLLREYNRQRDKTNAQKLREEVVSVDPTEAYRALIDHRCETWESIPRSVHIRGKKRRSEITGVKRQMVDAVHKVFKERRRYLPISCRAVHYALLNHRFLKNTDIEDSWYKNDKKSYKNLCDLLTRMRLIGALPFGWICDETRPMTTWQTWPNTRDFCRQHFDKFLKGYARDFLQSQPKHIEVICEKNSIFGMAKKVTSKYCIPTMSGRGFSGIDPYNEIANRYSWTDKTGLVVIVLSDFDPEGMEIVQVAGRTLRDDFELAGVDIVHCAVTEDQVAEYDLPADNEAKSTSSRYQRFVDRHGETVYELEALPPAALISELTKTIDGVIDTEAFNKELDEERKDAVFLEEVRQRASKLFGSLVPE